MKGQPPSSSSKILSDFNMFNYNDSSDSTQKKSDEYMNSDSA
jgi:hypothetical protein